MLARVENWLIKGLPHVAHLRALPLFCAAGPARVAGSPSALRGRGSFFREPLETPVVSLM